MKARDLAILLLAAQATGGCVTRVHTESAALRMAWPKAAATAVAIGPGAAGAFPSVSGDVLAGTAPSTLAAARVAQTKALTRALAKP